MLSFLNRVIACLLITLAVGIWAGKEFAIALVLTGVFFMMLSVPLRRRILAPSTPRVLPPTQAIAKVGPASAVVSTVLTTADSMQAINDVAEGCAIPPNELQLRALTPTCVHVTVGPKTTAAWETFAKMASLRAEVRETASLSGGADSVLTEAVLFVRGEVSQHLRGADTLQKLQKHFETPERFG